MQGFDKIPPVVLEEIDKGENQRWLPAAKFVDGTEPFLDGHN